MTRNEVVYINYIYRRSNNGQTRISTLVVNYPLLYTKHDIPVFVF